MNIPDSTPLGYTEEQKEMIKKRLLAKLDEAFEVNKHGKGTPIWMNVEFLLDRFNKGNYYGVIEIKVVGTSCNDAKEKERTHRLQEIYSEP